MAGKISNYIRCPATEESWDYPEWSNNNRFSVAGVRNTAGNSHGLYAIDLDSRLYLPIIQGIELQQPYLLVVDLLDLTPDELDSLGSYNDPSKQAFQARFAVRMHYFWQLKDSIQFAFVGSSHTSLSINPPSFTHRKVYNLAYSQCGPVGARSMINSYILNHCKNIKFIGTDLIMGVQNYSNGSNWNFIDGLGKSKGFVYDSLRFFWKNNLPDRVKNALIKKQYVLLDNIDSLNIESSNFGSWGGPNPTMYGGGGWDTTSSIFKENMVIWEKLISDLNQRKIYFLMFVTPESPAFITHGFGGRYGPSLDVAREIVFCFKQFENKYPYFRMYDAYQFGNHDYTDEEACDADHLCLEGAKKFSSRLDSLITTMIP
jgi:hypothetical protein